MEEIYHIFILIMKILKCPNNPSYIQTLECHTQSCSSYQNLYNRIDNDIFDMDSHVLHSCSSFLLMINKNKSQNTKTTEKQM
jgi:hypothetical protein